VAKGGRSRRGNLRRFSQISRVLVRHGFGFVFDVRRDQREKKGLQEFLAPNFGVRLRLTLDDLGPTFVKFGQVLSTRSDILPEGVLSELEKLQDTAKPMPAGVAQQIIEGELGAPVDEIFASFDPVPLGSASIGQVHRAVLRGGESVAVKVQRPEAPRRVGGDLELMRDFAALLDRRFGRSLFVDVRGLVAEFEVVIRRELDYGAEAENARRFAANFAQTPVIIPEVYLGLSTSRVLTEEYIEGTRFRDIRPLVLTPSERRRVASMGAEAIFKMAFEDGFFHGDPHPSNLFLTPGGNLALLDFGMVGYLSQGDIEALSRLFIAVIQRDAPAALRALERLGVSYATEIRGDLIRDLREFLNKYSGLSVGEVTLGQALSELVALARRYRLRMPPVFPLLTKALVTAEGLARSIDPTINVYEVASYIEDYPEQIRLLLTEVADGELEVQLKHGGLDELFGSVDVLANRLVFAVVTAALFVGSSMLGAFYVAGPQVPFLGAPLISFLGFTLSIIQTFILLTIIFRSGRL
jgi:ubiquinone biosynthesis protein